MILHFFNIKIPSLLDMSISVNFVKKIILTPLKTPVCLLLAVSGIRSIKLTPTIIICEPHGKSAFNFFKRSLSSLHFYIYLMNSTLFNIFVYFIFFKFKAAWSTQTNLGETRVQKFRYSCLTAVTYNLCIPIIFISWILRKFIIKKGFYFPLNFI